MQCHFGCILGKFMSKMNDSELTSLLSLQSYNKEGQSPCQVAANLGAICSTTSCTLIVALFFAIQ